MKPFNFLCSAHVAPFGHPTGVDPTKFHLVAPYSKESGEWLKLPWRDVHSGELFSLTTEVPCPPGYVRLKTYRDVLERYEFHPEPKSLGPDGEPCSEQTVGLPWPVDPLEQWGHLSTSKGVKRSGAVQGGEVHDWDEVVTEYGRPEK